jgi:hypothetical protein
MTDVMRLFHGDSPARQYESGQQKGGHFYCPVCGANAHQVYDIKHETAEKSNGASILADFSMFVSQATNLNFNSPK